MLVRHFKNHSPTPQKYVRLKLPTVAANNSFHLKLLANVRNCWQHLREWNAPKACVHNGTGTRTRSCVNGVNRGLLFVLPLVLPHSFY